MRNLQDSFLRFLADNLPTLAVHALRRTAENPAGDETLTANAINVQFLTDTPNVHISGALVVLDLVYEYDTTATDAKQKLWQILSANFMAPKLDYTNPTSPVATGSNMYWHPDRISFRRVWDPHFVRYSCRLPLYHRIPIVDAP